MLVSRCHGDVGRVRHEVARLRHARVEDVQERLGVDMGVDMCVDMFVDIIDMWSPARWPGSRPRTR